MDIKQLDCRNNPEYDNHESVFLAEDPASGLAAIIAIHSSALGPAAGGCRCWSYADQQAGATDALRLSRGMSFKNAMAGLPFGGGKAVMRARGGRHPSESEFRAFGQFVHSLGGRYITAEDVGVSTEDMQIVRQETPYVSGLPQEGEAVGGDPSPWTALGVFLSIEQAVKPAALSGLTVAVQGTGHVGYHLCRLLHQAGAKLVVADIKADSTARIAAEFAARVVPADEILAAPVDVLAPCALGGVLNEETIPEIKARLVAGAANNQLATAADGRRLHERQICFLPDYVINAGGIIAVAREYLGGSTRQDLEREIGEIPGRVARLLQTAGDQDLPPGEVADCMARELISRGPAAGPTADSVSGPAAVHQQAAAGHEA